MAVLHLRLQGLLDCACWPSSHHSISKQAPFCPPLPPRVICAQHYFCDLKPLFSVVATLLSCSGGRLLLRDFHPVSTKLITSRGAKHKVAGDYFEQGALSLGPMHLPGGYLGASAHPGS